jgi:hypothetical protein
MNTVAPQWQRICSQFSAAQPKNLALYVLCDCKNLETAKLMVSPLLKIESLADFGIRLALEPEEALKTLAYTTLRLTGRNHLSPTPIPTFRFLALPKELQLRVLENSSLVCSSTTKCTKILQRDHMVFGHKCLHRGMVYSELDRHGHFLGCFCRSGHSAFNFRCECQGTGFPSSFFLVSRLFRELSTYVFYSRNTFEVKIFHVSDVRQSILPPPTLWAFPSGSIGLLTNLHLDSNYDSAIDLEPFQPTHPSFKIWVHTISMLSEFANLGNLHLEVKI